jgi:hypothetical protein
MREAKGDLEFEDFSHVPYLRLTPQLIKCLDINPFEEGEGLGERRGSLDISSSMEQKFIKTRVMI